MNTTTAAASKAEPVCNSKAYKAGMQLVAAPTAMQPNQNNEMLRALVIPPSKLEVNKLGQVEKMLDSMFKAHMVNNEFQGTRDDLIALFSAVPQLAPMTLSDCVYAHEVLAAISQERERASSGSKRGDALVAWSDSLIRLAMDYFEWRMGDIPSRSLAESKECLEYFRNVYKDILRGDVERRLIVNLIDSSLFDRIPSAASDFHAAGSNGLPPSPKDLKLLSESSSDLRQHICFPANLDVQQLCPTEMLIEKLVAKHMVNDQFEGGREEVIASFAEASYMTPKTLSDCVYAHRTLGQISIARCNQPPSTLTKRGESLCETARRYIEHSMGSIAPRSAMEAKEAYDYYVLEFGISFFKDVYDEPVLRNLLLSPYRSAEPVPIAAAGPANGEPPGHVIDLVCRTHEALSRIAAMATATRALLTSPEAGSTVTINRIDRMLQEISDRAEGCSDDVDGLAGDAGVALHEYYDVARAKQLSRVQLMAKGGSAQLGA